MRVVLRKCNEARLPVVHEDIRFPKLVRRNSKVLHTTVLGLVPLEVVVIPLLRTKRMGGSPIKQCDIMNPIVCDFSRFEVPPFYYIHFVMLLRIGADDNRIHESESIYLGNRVRCNHERPFFSRPAIRAIIFWLLSAWHR